MVGSQSVTGAVFEAEDLLADHEGIFVAEGDERWRFVQGR